MLKLWFLLIITVLPKQDFTATAQAANDAYQRGDYDSAISIYKSLIEAGVSNESVYYNLGSSYYEAGQLGHALVSTLRAQQIDPRDPEINELLALIRTERIDFQGDERELLNRLATSTFSLFTLNELQWIALILWNVWFGLIVIALLLRKQRRRLRQPTIVIGVTLGIALLFLLPRLYTESGQPRAVLTAPSAEIMSGPGEDYLILFRLYSAAEMRLLDEVDSWQRFMLPDGRQGWIQKTEIETVMQDDL